MLFLYSYRSWRAAFFVSISDRRSFLLSSFGFGWRLFFVDWGVDGGSVRHDARLSVRKDAKTGVRQDVKMSVGEDAKTNAHRDFKLPVRIDAKTTARRDFKLSVRIDAKTPPTPAFPKEFFSLCLPVV